MSSTRARRIVLGLGLSLLALLVLEGASSALIFLWEAATRFERPLPERRHTVHDPELGWVNQPDLHAPDLYAPGRGFTSNAQGFRNVENVPVEVPEGRVRVIALGDSFTLGYGVDDPDTWPARLQARHPALQVVNMGQGGYGLDQAWLWYRRDGAPLEHQLLVFAFIGDDFERMRDASFRGYGKPLVRASDAGLEVGNVPVSKGSFRAPLLTQNLKLLERLRVVELARRVVRRLGGGPGAVQHTLDEDEARRVAVAIFSDLARLARERGARLALVLLPNLDWRDLSRVQAVPAYARQACEEAAAAGIPWIDLGPEFAALEDRARRSLFIPPGEIDLPGAAGHYSAAGNEFVAAALLRRLGEAGLLRLPPQQSR